MTKTKTKKDYVALENSRLDEQCQVMRQIIADGVCPFCPENLARYHKQPILRAGKYWVLTHNQWPYGGTKHHLLIIYKTHIEHLEEMAPAAGQEMIELFQGASKEYGVSGGGLAMRFGGPEYGSTVRHLHAHLIHPDLDDPQHPGIKFGISKGKKG